MRLLVLGAAVVVAGGLGGCERHGSIARHEGRYFGVGIYNPNAQWTNMVGADSQKAASAAKTVDDQVIIVSEDSETGEIRACGDLTGYCIGMNPWKKTLTPSQTVPINLTEHVRPAAPAGKK